MCVHFHGSEAVERKTEEKEKLYRTTMKFSVPRDVKLQSIELAVKYRQMKQNVLLEITLFEMLELHWNN